MKSAKCIIAACLTATMVFQSLAPTSSALAEEVGAVSGIAAYAGSASAAVENGVQGTATAEDEGSSATGGASSGGAGSGSGSADAGTGNTADSSKDESASNVSGSGAENADAAQDGSQQEAASQDSAQQEEPATVAAGEKITTLEQLQAALKECGGSAEGLGSKATKISFINSKALLIVSNTDPAIYQDATIERSGATVGGEFSLCTTQDGYSFQGFGSEAYPFRGVLDTKDDTVGVNRALYNAIELSDSNSAIKLNWYGTSGGPLVAGKVIGNSKTLDAQVTVAAAYKQSGQDVVPCVSGALLDTVTGPLTVKASYSFKGSNKDVRVTSAGNAGLLANTVASGAFTIDSISGIDSASSTRSVSATAANSSAGGLIGCVNNGASVAIKDGSVDGKNVIDVSGLTVTATGTGGSAGGFIGKATNLSLAIPSNASVKPAANVGDASTTYAGGAFGSVSFAGAVTFASGMFDFGDATVQLGAKKRAGGLFGELDVTNGDVTVQGGTYKSKLTAGADTPDGTGSGRGSYGGLAGNVSSSVSDPMRALNVVRNGDDVVTVEIERDNSNGKLCYVGGVAGYIGDNSAKVGNSAVVLDGVQVTCNGAAKPYTDKGKYGGAIGVVDSSNILDVRDFKLSSGKIGEDTGGSAGIAGSAWQGVIKFSGTTDLSQAQFSDSNYSAQLVYENQNALIFAMGSGSNDGWKYLRSNNAVKADDIHDYGEVIRLGSGLTIGLDVDKDSHKLILPEKLAKTGEGFSLASVNDFAKLAITWQTSGYYSLVSGIDTGNASNLASSTIEVASSIDLSGTGLTGLSRDSSDNAAAFKGTLKGNGTINLAVGEPYGMRNGAAIGSDDTSDGNGKIYRHSRLGLFAGVDGATVTGVTIGGSMKFENGTAVSAGSLAGTLAGSVAISGATFQSSISYSASYGDSLMQVGGIAGYSSAAEVNFTSNATAKCSIGAQGTSNAQTRVGGAIGYVDTASATYNVGGLSISGSITAGDSNAIAQIGGFIGCIGQGGNGVYKTVNITGLAYNDFSMNVGENGDPKNGAGGLLGYSWGNAIVNIGFEEEASSYALTASSTSVTANSVNQLGGLMYATSGHWIINNKAIDLGSTTFNADNADTFGVLVCRGGCVSAGSQFGSESYTGLYLEDRAYWGTKDDPGAYKVEEIAVNAPKVNVYDEWVAKGRGFDGNKEAKLIDGDWNAIVSLHTEVNALDMSNDNSYQNRSNFGASHKTNAYTRYYYNLDRALAVAKGTGKSYAAGTWLDTPEELLLMCACRYAPKQVKNLIAPGIYQCFESGIKIGADSGEVQTIDLAGYSYYPTNFGSSFTIKNAKIAFSYSKIKQEQANNKPNNEASQHENMHCGLVRTINDNLTVTNATLAGTVGSVVNDPDGSKLGSKSGALVCRYIYGNNSPYKIAIDGLTLDGLAVDGVIDSTEYAPLLVNGMTTYLSLEVKNVRCENYGSNAKAATSLFGKLGGASADRVTATFSNIALPGKSGESMFTKATLLDSFGYGSTNSGSADYTFLESDANAGNVTYGKEIDSGGEYAGKQLWYYDENLHGTDAGLVVCPDGRKASATSPVFGGYLPYVRQGSSTGSNVQYHEIKVNQRIPNISKGCGTYGDPYSVTNASELGAIANYVNNKTALDGWEVTVTTNQEQLCTRRQSGDASLEATYAYNQSSGKWEKKGNASDTLTADTMHRYLQSAYYSIEPSDESGAIEVDAQSFSGLGSRSNPFRGVIVGNLAGDKNGKIVIKNGTSTANAANASAISGLIPYSYGSVVKDLDVEYTASISAIPYANNDNDGVPTAFFGGVVGCILGGDNIIDGVTVSGGSVKAADSSVADAAIALLSGQSDNSKLVPIGGYVGAITGGGVIFRGMSSDDS